MNESSCKLLSNLTYDYEERACKMPRENYGKKRKKLKEGHNKYKKHDFVLYRPSNGSMG